MLLQELRANFCRRFEHGTNVQTTLDALLAISIIYLPLRRIYQNVVDTLHLRKLLCGNFACRACCVTVGVDAHCDALVCCPETE
jgi:hypothetical protein